MSDNPIPCDIVASGIRRDPYGKFYAVRVLIRDGVVVSQEDISGDRALAPAVRIAMQDVEMLARSIPRNHFDIITP